MSYVESIKTALFIFPIIAFLFTVPFILNQYHKYGSIHKLRVFIVYSFILYMMTVYFLVILPLPKISEVTRPISEMVQLQPFAFIPTFIQETSFVISDPSTYVKALTENCFYTVVFNIFMTIPFGMYLRYYFKCSLKKVAICSFLLSLFFELTQLSGLYFIYPSPYRLFDVDDLLMNTLGGVLGYFLMGLFTKLLPTRDKIDEDSLKDGTQVSGLRRITLFFLDLFLCIMITSILSFTFGGGNLITWISFFLYFVVLPKMMNQQTLGSKFLNVQFLYPNHWMIRQTLRMVFYFFYYLFLPFHLLIAFTYLKDFLMLEARESILLFCGTLLFLFFFYFIHILVLFIRKRIYYDYLFRITYQSTIGESDLK